MGCVAFPAARLKLHARCPHAARPGGGGTVCAPRRATRGVEVANAVCIALALCLQCTSFPTDRRSSTRSSKLPKRVQSSHATRRAKDAHRGKRGTITLLLPTLALHRHFVHAFHSKLVAHASPLDGA